MNISTREYVEIGDVEVRVNTVSKVVQIAVSAGTPDYPDVIYALTDTGVLWSANGEQAWKKLDPVPGTALAIETEAKKNEGSWEKDE